MKLALMSDIQGNYEALRRFFKVVDHEGITNVFCGGDIVGPGDRFEDNRCITLVRERRCVSVRGNHDDDLLTIVDKDVDARRKFWSENIDYVRSLPLMRRHDALALLHNETTLATAPPAVLDATIILCGHTHLPDVSIRVNGRRERVDLSNRPLSLDPAKKYLVNPGGVGLYFDKPQTYMIYDDLARTLELRWLSI